MTHLQKCKAEHPDYRFILSTHIPTGKGAGYHSSLTVAVLELDTITTWMWLSGSWVPLQLECGCMGQIVAFRNHSFTDDSQCCLHGCLYVWEVLFVSESKIHILFWHIGVPRETKEEKEIADFDIFDDPESPFSTFNFQYPNQAFKRLHDLMYFNTLNNIDVSIFPTISMWSH